MCVLQRFEEVDQGGHACRRSCRGVGCPCARGRALIARTPLLGCLHFATPVGGLPWRMHALCVMHGAVQTCISTFGPAGFVQGMKDGYPCR